MHILFLGTGAADYDQALICSCKNCSELRALGGPNVRTYSSVLIDGRLLIDCGRTVPARLAECLMTPGAIGDVLITHSHDDHLDPGALFALAGTQREGDAPLNVWCNAAACDVISADRAYENTGSRILLHEVQAGEHLEAAGFAVRCLPARHAGPEEGALNFVIAEGDRRLLYATDSAWPLPETWAALADLRLSAAIVEATFGPLEPGQHPDLLTHHLNWREAARLHKEMIATERLEPGAPVYATHFSLHHNPVHEKCCDTVREMGLQLAFDGCELTI
jgi:ribonuclease BN (tRNA processing enzyme)